MSYQGAGISREDIPEIDDLMLYRQSELLQIFDILLSETP